MKKGIVRYFSGALALSLLLATASCTQESPGKVDTDTTTQATETTVVDQSESIDFAAVDTFRIIRPETVSSSFQNDIIAFYKILKEKYNVTLKDDWCRNESDAEGYEILIGDVDREASKSLVGSLRSNDYIIAVRGDKLVILGGSESASSSALEYVTQHYFSNGESAVKNNGENVLLYRATYPVELSELMGRPVTDYSVVYSNRQSGGKEAAMAVASTILSQTGYTVGVRLDSKGETDCEIIVGQTSRSPELTIPDTLDYTVGCEGTKIYLNGGSLIAIYGATGKLLTEAAANNSLSFSDTYNVYYEILRDKTMYAMGDSYFQGAGLNMNTEVWPALIALKYGMTFRNYGIGGSTVSSYVTDHNPMVNRITSMALAKPDIILFEGGRNDYNVKAPIGTNSDTTKETFKGAVRSALTQLHERYPDALIICVTNWLFDQSYSYQYANAMEEIAGFYDFAVCINATDLSKIPVDMTNADFREAYCIRPTDVSHMNSEGMQYVMPYFERLIAEYYLDFIS